MGKPTGFMEYDRCEARSVEPKERIKNFDEFHIFLSKEKQREQAARCMDCGVPFCQSGMTVAGMSFRLPAAQSGTGVERSALYRKLSAGI